MRVAVHKLLDAESFVFLFEHDGNVDIEAWCVGREAFVIGVFNVSAGKFTVKSSIDAVSHEYGIEVAEGIKPALQIDHRPSVAIAVDE